MKLQQLISSCLLVLLSLAGTAASAAGNTVEDFRPLFKLRSDLQCWPTWPAAGGNSGDCVSKSAFIASAPPVFTETYGETVNGREHQLITYWAYYGNQNACSTFGGAHVDDWENVSVHLVDGNLRHITYSQHNGRYTITPDMAEMDGNHPLVYVGKYSHGSYHDQRARASADAWAFFSGDYCFYWKDPRGPGETWSPQTRDLAEVGMASVFPGSQNPLTRELRPHQRTVCRVDGGQVIGGVIDATENTCARNPDYLQDPALTLQDLFYLDVY
ncbi:hypothetical protein [Microbulbifer elongatus]|uniref:hypothetical protein n=1 Tax=Microbulbifer elongatus TaxID=86173 RepID=UPI001E53FCF0|nr:hypothetical protein [Microbulbifer elongatus]